MATIYCGANTFQNVEAILFDKDGTLADSHQFLHALALARSSFVEAQVPGVKESLLKTFGLVNGRINPVGLIAVSTRQEDEIATAACIAATGRDWIEAKTIAHTALLDADRALPQKAKLTPLFDGALPLLQSLARSDLKVGILSADTEENVRDFVRVHSLAAYFHLQMGSRNGLSKPDSRLLDLACHRLSVSPAATLIIGDSSADIELAKRGGALGAVGVTWGGTHSNQLANADVILDHFDEITFNHLSA
jgi:phosphoglycolate phosphatase